jgi:hypothetical protein
VATRLRYNLNVNAEFDLFKRDITAQGREVTLNALGNACGIVEVPTTAEGIALDFGDVASPGWLYMHNLDDTNFVKWGVDDGGDLIEVGKMKAKEEAWFRLDPTVTIRIQADTDDVLVQFEVFDD